MRDYRFIALTFMVGMVVGMSMLHLEETFMLIISLILFIIWGFALVHYIDGDK